MRHPRLAALLALPLLAGCGDAVTHLPPLATSPIALPSPASWTPVTLQTSVSHGDHGGFAGDTVTVTGVGGVPAATSSALTAALNASAAKQLTDAQAEAAQEGGESDIPKTLDTHAYVLESDDDYVTVDLDADVCYCGAHGRSIPAVTTVRRATGATVTLADLAAPGKVSALQGKLAEVAKMLLPKAVGPDQPVSDVAAAVKRAPVFPRVDGLEVMFGEYDVASFAAGRPFVVVPWSDLTGLTAAEAPPTSPVAPSVVRAGTFDRNPVEGLPAGTLTDQAGVTVGDESYYLVTQVVGDDPGDDRTVVTQLTTDAEDNPTQTPVATVPSSTACTALPASVVSAAAISC